jgi:hypothetical protein
MRSRRRRDSSPDGDPDDSEPIVRQCLPPDRRPRSLPVPKMSTFNGEKWNAFHCRKLEPKNIGPFLVMEV